MRSLRLLAWALPCAMVAVLVASSGVALAAEGASGAECPNEAFRTGPSAMLPDCRAYEQATAVDKNGGGLEGSIGQVKAADNGSGITFFTQAGVPGGVGAQEFPTFMAGRGESGWSTRGLLPPQGLGNQAFIRGFSSDLRYVATEAVKSSTKSETVGESSLLLEDTSDHSLATIVPYTEAETGPTVPAFVLAGVSHDGGQVFFESRVPLGSGAPVGQQDLFVWDRATGHISVVGVLPAGEGGERAPEGSFAGPYRWWENRLSAGGVIDNFYVAEEHAISESGDRAYFTAAGTGQLYLRSGLDGSSPSTVRVSAPMAGVSDPDGPLPAAFQMATPDSSVALFLSSEHLTENATTGPSDEGKDLYRYEVSTGQLVDLVSDATDANGAEVQGVLGMSKDASVVYFVANGVLAPGATLGTCSLAEGGGTCNLYRYSSTSGTSHITFIARLGGSSANRLNGDARNWSPSSVRAGTLSQMLEPTARVSADGGTLLFRSYEPITGYDNQGCEAFAEPHAEGRCPEFYRYSAATNETVCVSCSPTGVPPVGPPSLRSRVVDVFAAGGVTGTLATQTRNLSADGNRIFFETPDALVPADVNGESGCVFHSTTNPAENNCQDVYEWEAPDAGDPTDTCTVVSGAYVPSAAGCLYLISSGQSSTSSNIADIDETGENVFFFTESQLVPVDKDRLVDVYDARVGGGLASQHPPLVTTCAGEACQVNPTPAPSAPQPASSTLIGPPNSPAMLSTSQQGGSTRVSPPSSRHKRAQKKKPQKGAKRCKKKGVQCKSKLSSHRRGARPAHANRGGVR
jgi:hypothetical protein